jgi:colanic acid biosynthesis protein WcaH
MTGTEELPRFDVKEFKRVIQHVSLFSNDLLVKNEAGRFLLGLRTSAPAKGCWFVPGGRSYKGETLPAAFEWNSRNAPGEPVSLIAAA